MKEMAGPRAITAHGTSEDAMGRDIGIAVG